MQRACIFHKLKILSKTLSRTGAEEEIFPLGESKNIISLYSPIESFPVFDSDIDTYYCSL